MTEQIVDDAAATEPVETVELVETAESGDADASSKAERPVPAKLLSLLLIGLLVAVVIVMLVTNPSTSDDEPAAEPTVSETDGASGGDADAGAPTDAPPVDGPGTDGAAPSTAPKVTSAFISSAKANPSMSQTIVLLGDQTGASPEGWAPQMGAVFSTTLDRPTATAYWDNATGAYGPGALIGEGRTHGPVGFWNGSAEGQTASYALANLDKLITPDVVPDLVLLNYGHTEDASTPLAEAVQPLIDALKDKYPNASIAVIKQNPTGDTEFAQRLAGYASAMDAAGVQVIDVFGAFPTDPAQLTAVMESDVMPNAEGQKLWLTTMLTAMGLPTS